jgi:hypothetical protein
MTLCIVKNIVSDLKNNKNYILPPSSGDFGRGDRRGGWRGELQ